MKFEDYTDGDLVDFKGNVYKITKSKITHNAFKLRSVGGLQDELVDIDEIRPHSVAQLQSFKDMSYEEFSKKIDSDADFTGIYHIQD